MLDERIRRPRVSFPAATRRRVARSASIRGENLNRLVRLRMTRLGLSRDEIKVPENGPRDESSRREPATRMRHWILVFLAAFGLVGVVRWEIIDSPPYWDAITALWNEAAYLAETRFDYRGLGTHAGQWHDYNGGRRSYLTSVIPSVIGALMLVCQDATRTIIAYRMLVFASAGASATFLYRIFRLELPPFSSLLACLATFSVPLLSVQIDLLSMEMPMVAFAMACAWFLATHRYWTAIVMSFMVYAVKATGFIVTAALLATLVYMLVRRHPVIPRPRLTLLGCAFVLTAELFIILLGDTHTTNMRGGANLAVTLFWCPDLVLIAGVCLAAGLADVIASRGRRRDPDQTLLGTNIPATLSIPFSFSPLAFFSGCVIVLNLLAVQFVPMLPRYLCLSVPFLFLLLTRSLLLSRLPRVVGQAFLGLLFVFNLANWNGSFFPSQATIPGWALPVPAKEIAGEGSHLERSREYFAHHRANIAAIRELASRDPNETIIAGYPYVHMMAMPCMGYVKTPMKGYSINGFSNVAGGFKDSADTFVDVPKDPVFIRAATTFYGHAARFDVPSPEPRDLLLLQEQEPDRPVVFQKRFPPSFDESTRREWYRARIYPDQSLNERVLQWIADGDYARAIADIRAFARVSTAFWLDPLFLATLQSRLGDPSEAESRFLEIWSLEADGIVPGDDSGLVPSSHRRWSREEASFLGRVRDALSSPDGLLRAGTLWLTIRQPEIARKCFLLDICQRNPRLLDLVQRQANAEQRLRMGDNKEADSRYREIIAAWPKLAPPHVGLSRVALARGHFQEAVKEAKTAISFADGNADAHHCLGLALARLGRMEESRREFDRARALAPIRYPIAKE